MSHDLRIEKLIDGTPEEVFEAFTEPDAMLVWYIDHPGWEVEIVSCDVRVGGTTSVRFGSGAEKYREDMTYTEVERPYRLSYDEDFVMPDSSSFLTKIAITFEDQAGKTLMTLLQTGFPDAEQRDAHQGGWPNFLNRLEQVVVDRRVS